MQCLVESKMNQRRREREEQVFRAFQQHGRIVSIQRELEHAADDDWSPVITAATKRKARVYRNRPSRRVPKTVHRSSCQETSPLDERHRGRSLLQLATTPPSSSSSSSSDRGRDLSRKRRRPRSKQHDFNRKSQVLYDDNTGNWFALPDGSLMIQKIITSDDVFGTTRSCARCGFRDWTKGDACYLLRMDGAASSTDSETDSDREATDAPAGASPRRAEQELLKWVCPDCALGMGLPRSRFRPTVNRLRPFPKHIRDATRNKPIPPGIRFPARTSKGEGAGASSYQPRTTTTGHQKRYNWESQYEYLLVEEEPTASFLACGPPAAAAPPASTGCVYLPTSEIVEDQYRCFSGVMESLEEPF